MGKKDFNRIKIEVVSNAIFETRTQPKGWYNELIVRARELPKGKCLKVTTKDKKWTKYIAQYLYAIKKEKKFRQLIIRIRKGRLFVGWDKNIK